MKKIVNGIGKLLSMAQFRGKHRLVHRLGAALSKQCPEVELSFSPSCKVVLRLSDRIERLMWSGSYEPELAQIMKLLLNPGDAFADVGAHIGYFSVLAASLVGPTGQVLSFEADLDNFRRLEMNTEAQVCVTRHQVAVSDTVGYLDFLRSSSPSETGWGTILSSDEKRESVSIPAMTLDAAFQKHGLRRLEFVKIDAEGAERRILRGSCQTMETLRPVFFMEVNPHCLARDGAKPSDIVQLLREKGYWIEALAAPYSYKAESLLAIPIEKAQLKDKISSLSITVVPLSSLV